jgi:hypothetical protein
MSEQLRHLMGPAQKVQVIQSQIGKKTLTGSEAIHPQNYLRGSKTTEKHSVGRSYY